jgi:threonine dehydratase
MSSSADPANPPLAEDPVRVSDIQAAIDRIAGRLARTPLIFDRRRDAYLKLENQQVTGSYKVRGAYNAIAAGVARGDRRPVVAASAGNHGKGVAWAAQAFGLAACIVVPRGAPRTKVAGARELGAEVLEHGHSFDDCTALAVNLADERGWRFIHPFDDPEVIAGQGTVAAELDAGPGDVVLVPIGGGGLAAGTAIWLAARGARVVGVQVEGVDAMRRVLRGEPRRRAAPTIADGLVVAEPGRLSRQICARLVSNIVIVGEDEVRRALLDLRTRDGFVVEGAGAVSVAGLAHVPADAGRRIAVVSGGNLDESLYASLFAAADTVIDSAPSSVASRAPIGGHRKWHE